KDGIGAALLFAELYAKRRSERKSMFDVLDGLAREYGHYASGQLAITMKGVDGIAKIQSVMRTLREKTIDKVGPLAVLSMTDVSKGIRVAKGETTKIPLPPSDVLFYELESKCRIIARPSGTEPKLKIYFDVREPMKKDEPLADADARAQARMGELKAAFAAIAGLEGSV
ncbi:MAG: phospho-sugar mutase, partial [Polyangiaceae bacterium]|nr:phospho-sugar mutase [Polyangiaceae bacterium]